MNFAQQLSTIENQESYAGFIREDGPNDEVRLRLHTDGGNDIVLKLSVADFASLTNRWGEIITGGAYKNGAWGLQERSGQRVLYLIKNQKDLREGVQFYLCGPVVLPPDRTAKLRAYVWSIAIVDEGTVAAVYQVSDGSTGACVQGRDRGQYREVADKALSQIVRTAEPCS